MRKQKHLVVYMFCRAGQRPTPGARRFRVYLNQLPSRWTSLFLFLNASESRAS